MGELEKCGLIERDRRGLGKPNLIYVKNFNSGVPPNERFQIRQNDDSGVGNMEIQDSSEQRGTNTNKNYIDESNTNPILSSEEMGTEVNEVKFQHIKNSGDYIFRCFQQSFVIMSRVL